MSPEPMPTAGPPNSPAVMTTMPRRFAKDWNTTFPE